MIFDVAPAELLVLGAVALIVIPPKDLPKAMRIAGQWVSRARGMARQFRSGFDDMIRESEFKEMETRWKAENERIMAEFPTTDSPQLMAPVADPDPAPMMVADPDAAPPPAAKKAVAKKPAGKKPAAKKAVASVKPRAKAKTANAGVERP